MKKIGETEGGADTVLDVFCDYLGENGLVVLPTHTYGTVKANGYIYDPEVAAQAAAETSEETPEETSGETPADE